MQKIRVKLRVYLKESVIDNQGRLDKNIRNKNIDHSLTKP